MVVGQRQRDKQRTRDRISQVANGLFLQRGFDEVTVSEVAHAAGVSKVTVFAHFPRKEDLLLDRAPEAAALVRAALRERPVGVDPVEALRQLAVELMNRRHPLSGLTDGVDPFLRTVVASPALLTRVGELVGDLERTLAVALEEDEQPGWDSRLLAALIVAAYRTVVATTAESLLNGQSEMDVVVDHERRLHHAFDVVKRASRALPS